MAAGEGPRRWGRPCAAELAGRRGAGGGLGLGDGRPGGGRVPGDGWGDVEARPGGPETARVRVGVPAAPSSGVNENQRSPACAARWLGGGRGTAPMVAVPHAQAGGGSSGFPHFLACRRLFPRGGRSGSPTRGCERQAAEPSGVCGRASRREAAGAGAAGGRADSCRTGAARVAGSALGRPSLAPQHPRPPLASSPGASSSEAPAPCARCLLTYRPPVPLPEGEGRAWDAAWV